MSEIPVHNEEQRGHETRDARFKEVVFSGVVLLGLMALGLIASVVLLTVFKETTQQPGNHPETFTQPQTAPPLPRLQPDPHANLLQMRMREDSLLNSYGLIAHDSQHVRIPVSRAMELVAKKLPVRATK